jgi:hypothetical protein
MESSEQSAGAESQSQAPGPGAEAGNNVSIPSGMRALGELLQAGEPGQPGGEEDQESGSEEKTDLIKFNDLAGKLGMDLDALYKLQITSSEDGEPVTIEALKDMHKERSDFDLAKLEWEERRTMQEQDLTRAKAELHELMQMLPEKAIKPEVLERIRDRTAAQTALERKKTLEVIPEWKDAKTREADITGMAEHLQGYGFPVNYLEQVVNHQQLKYIRDNWLREQRVRKALESVRAGSPGKTPASKTQKKAPQKQPLSGIQKGNARNKLEAVFSQVKD